MFDKVTPKSYSRTKRAILKKLKKLSKKTGGTYYTVENINSETFGYFTNRTVCVIQKCDCCDTIVGCYMEQ